MDAKQAFRNKSLLFLLQIFLLSLISANTYSAPLPLARSVTRADMGCNMIPTVTSSNPAVATASIKGPIVIPGIHTLSVNSLAQAKQVTSKAYPDQTSALGITETLTIISGHSQITVDVTASDSLQEIASKIKSAATAAPLNANAYVIATQPNEYLLLIGATQTGIANDINVLESGINGNILEISKELTSASNATFTLDGLSYSTASNNNIIGEWLIINFMNVGQASLTVNEI